MLLSQEQCFRMILTMRLPSLSKYLEGQMISGDIPSASAMSFSPRGHEQDSAFASVAEPALPYGRAPPETFPAFSVPR